MKEEDYILIEKYLDGALDASEQAAFETRLNKDIALQEELSLRRSMNDFISNQKQDQAFISSLEQQGAEHFNTAGKVVDLKARKPWALWMASAAAAAIALIFIVRIAFPAPSLYEQYNPHQKVSFSLRGEGDISNQIEKAFNQKDYQKAYDLSKSFLEGDTFNIQIQEVLGRSALALDKFAEAEKTFLDISQGTSLFKNRGLWYLGLNYLKQDKITAAKTAFSAIPKEDQKLYRQAQELLSEL